MSSFVDDADMLSVQKKCNVGSRDTVIQWSLTVKETKELIICFGEKMNTNEMKFLGIHNIQGNDTITVTTSKPPVLLFCLDLSLLHVYFKLLQNKFTA